MRKMLLALCVLSLSACDANSIVWQSGMYDSDSMRNYVASPVGSSDTLCVASWTTDWAQVSTQAPEGRVRLKVTVGNLLDRTLYLNDERITDETAQRPLAKALDDKCFAHLGELPPSVRDEAQGALGSAAF